jgi:NAD(P)-dependent dehydrogenase (short-subunit alcohol dehydrogenase family)
MTLHIAQEFTRSGIRMLVIAPTAPLNTPLVEGLLEDARESLNDQMPVLSPLGKPAGFAALAKHTIRNRMLNGEAVRLDVAIRIAPE